MCSSEVVIREMNHCLPALDEHMRTMRAVPIRRMVEESEFLEQLLTYGRW